MPLKVGAAVVVLLVIVVGAMSAILPSLTDPKNALARVAKKVAAGPKGEAEVKDAKNEFDEAVRNFLKQNGTQSSQQLSKSLQDALNDGAFEVHVFDLPRGLTVVEIDTILQASDYLMLKKDKNVKVSSVNGMEVFDGAKIVGEQAAPVLVLLGHTGGQTAHRPLIKVFSLMPDDVEDQSMKSVPDIKAEGTVAFAKNDHDVNIEYSLFSQGVNEHVFSQNTKLTNVLPDETVRGTLKFVNGHYEPQMNGLGGSPLSILYAAAKTLSGTSSPQYDKVLGKFAPTLAVKDGTAQEFTITPMATSVPSAAPQRGSRRQRAKAAPSAAITYNMQGKTLAYNIDLLRNGPGDWAIVDVKKTDLNAQPQPGTVAQQPATDTTATTETTSTTTGTETKVENSQAPKADDKIITATPKITPETTSLTDTGKKPAKTADAQPTKTASATPPQTPPATNDKTEKAKAQAQEALSMIQQSKNNKTDTKTPATTEPEKTEPEQPKTNSQQVVGEGASISDKIEVAQIKLRSGPGTGYKQVSTLPRGAKIKVIGKTSGWYKVRVNGKDGYVYGGFVDYKTPDAYETLTVQKAGTLTDEHAQPVGESKPGERLVVLGGSKDGKVRVQLSSGKTAYVNKESVDQQKDDTPQFVP
jgi:hypothetical protein